MVAILVAYLYVSCAANYLAFSLTFNDKLSGDNIFIFVLIISPLTPIINIPSALILKNLMTFLFVGFYTRVIHWYQRFKCKFTAVFFHCK